MFLNSGRQHQAQRPNVALSIYCLDPKIKLNFSLNFEKYNYTKH